MDCCDLGSAGLPGACGRAGRSAARAGGLDGAAALVGGNRRAAPPTRRPATRTRAATTGTLLLNMTRVAPSTRAATAAERRPPVAACRATWTSRGGRTLPTAGELTNADNS